MGKQEQNEDIHTNSGHVLVESASGSSSSESEGGTSPANVEKVEYMTHTEDEDEEEEEDEDDEDDEGEHVDDEHKEEENRDVQPEEDVAEAIVEDVEYMTHSEDEDEEDVEGEHSDKEEGDEEHGAEQDVDRAKVDNVEYMIHSEDEEDVEVERKDDEDAEMEHGAEEHIDVRNVENVEYMTHSEDEDEEEDKGDKEDECGAVEDEVKRGDVTASEEDQEEGGIWQCNHYPHCTEVFDDRHDWFIHIESTCPFRESERVPEESQNVNQPLPDTPRCTDFTQGLEIRDDDDDDDDEEDDEQNYQKEDEEEGEDKDEDGGEEKQKYKCHNPNCPESYEDNEDLFFHELNCQYRVSVGSLEFDQEENPPSPDPSRHSDLMQDSPPSSSINLSCASPSRDPSEMQPTHEQPTRTKAKDIQHAKPKIKLLQCGACGELLQSTREALNNHTCSKAECKFCQCTLTDLSDLVQHFEENHSNETKFECPYCGFPPNKSEEFNYDNIKEHFQSQNCPKGKYYKCSFCEETVLFKFKIDYIQHASQYHLHGYQCCRCLEIVNEISHYRSHVKQHKKRIFKCPYCGELRQPSSGPNLLRRHLKNHMSERSELFKKGETPKTYQCYKCQKEYVSEAFLKSHGKRIHGTEKLFKCLECSMEFKSSNKAEAHFKEKHEKVEVSRQLPWRDRKHSETNITNCGACGEVLQGTHEEWNNHNCSEAECQFCIYKFNDFHDFVQHYENNHDDETGFLCPYCGVRLNKSSEISIEEQHSKRKNCGKGNYYKCKKCEEVVIFKLDKDFKEHNSQYHFRGYQCYICRKIFTYPDFKSHNHVTTEIFKCQYCGKLFTPFYPNVLHQHLRDHANERSELLKKGETSKTYQCPECQKHYVTEVYLTNHGIQKHGTEYLFKCSECDMEFPTKTEADFHFKERHEDPKQGMIMPQCGVCGEILKGTSEELNNHHCTEAKCQFCEYKLKGFDDLILHYEQNHNNETNFECPYCGYPPNKSAEINYNEIKEHLQSKNCPKGNYYKCKKCEETVIFKLKKDFLEHDSQYHFRGYQCCICRKIIDPLANYMSHGDDIHQNSYIYKCPYCCKLLRPSSGHYLREHVKKHESDRSGLFKEGKTPKTFRCPKCKKEFVFEHFLKSHGKQKHGTENLFDCSQCGMEFPTSNDADAHFEEDHPGLKRRRQHEDPDKDETSHSKKPRSLQEE